MKTDEAIRRIKDHMIVHHMEEEPHCHFITEALQMAINALGAIDQIKWERDVAIAQLEELGIGFGEKIGCEHCEYKDDSGRNLWCVVFNKIMPEDGYCCFFDHAT